MSAKIQNAFESLYNAITEDAPESRDRALALTKLEECVHWVSSAYQKKELEAKRTIVVVPSINTTPT